MTFFWVTRWTKTYRFIGRPFISSSSQLKLWTIFGEASFSCFWHHERRTGRAPHRWQCVNVRGHTGAKQIQIRQPMFGCLHAIKYENVHLNSSHYSMPAICASCTIYDPYQRASIVYVHVKNIFINKWYIPNKIIMK